MTPGLTIYCPSRPCEEEERGMLEGLRGYQRLPASNNSGKHCTKLLCLSVIPLHMSILQRGAARRGIMRLCWLVGRVVPSTRVVQAQKKLELIFFELEYSIIK